MSTPFAPTDDTEVKITLREVREVPTIEEIGAGAQRQIRETIWKSLSLLSTETWASKQKGPAKDFRGDVDQHINVVDKLEVFAVLTGLGAIILAGFILAFAFVAGYNFTGNDPLWCSIAAGAVLIGIGLMIWKKLDKIGRTTYKAVRSWRFCKQVLEEDEVLTFIMRELLKGKDWMNHEGLMHATQFTKKNLSSHLTNPRKPDYTPRAQGDRINVAIYWLIFHGIENVLIGHAGKVKTAQTAGKGRDKKTWRNRFRRLHKIGRQQLGLGLEKKWNPYFARAL